MKIFTAFFACCALGISANAAIIRVDSSSAASAPDGSGWTTAFARLQPALAAAAAGDTIWVAKGTYYSDTLSNRSASITMKQNVALFGGFAGSESAITGRNWRANRTVLSGDIGVRGSTADNAYHVVLGASQATLDGFVVVKGNANDVTAQYSGAGMLCSGTSPMIRNCIFRGNSAYQSGGGLYAGMFGHPIIQHCWFDSNTASSGGGCSIDGSIDTVRNCLFTNNAALGSGGGLTMGAGGLVVNCVFANDSASYGGGIDIAFVNCLVTQCTFFNNRYGGGGGSAITNSFCNPSLTNCIMWDAKNQEVYNAREGDAPVITNCCIKGGPTTYGCINTNPQFSDTTMPAAGPDGIWGTVDDGLALTQASPCVNAGLNGSENSFIDFTGGTRVLAGTVDMGAYEYRGIARPWIVSLATLYVDEDDTLTLGIGLLVILDSDDVNHSLLADTGAHYTVLKVNDTLVRIIPVHNYNGPLSVPIRVYGAHGDTSAAYQALITVIPSLNSVKPFAARMPRELTLSAGRGGPRNQLRITVGIPASSTYANSPYRIGIYDMRGLLVWQRTLVSCGPGYYELALPDARSGAYIVRLQGHGTRLQVRCPVVR
jgi:hypothetical protein